MLVTPGSEGVNTITVGHRNVVVLTELHVGLI